MGNTVWKSGLIWKFSMLIHVDIDHCDLFALTLLLCSDPRRLLVRAATGCLTFWFFVCHAPHSGRSLDERKKWWADCDQILRELLDGDPLFFMADANAEPGEFDGSIVLGPDFATSSNTCFFRDFPETWKLCLPATGPEPPCMG
eukprot:s1669_g11.t1